MQTCERTLGMRFLAGELPIEQEEVFSQHIAECERCRRWLEEDSGDMATWDMAKHLALAPSGDEQGDKSGFYERLSIRSGSARTDSQLTHQIRNYLAPTDDPRYLGRLGIYEIAAVIGRGGMGIVLKAFEPSLNRFVAIKMLEPTLVSIGSARQRFAREARAMAAIAHENVVPVYAVDQYRDLPYFVMEYVVGGTLEHRIFKEGPFEISSIVRIAMQMADALAAADAQGLVHRDIKPGNILLDHGTERVRVADFGLARIASEASDTRSGMIAGTPQYMSPEQVKGTSIDARSDLFSLGSVMYAMCTGHSPFRADGVYAVMQRIVNDQPRSIRQQNPNIPEWLQSFIFCLLQKSPSNRFLSAAQVAQELRSELAYLQNPTKVKQPIRTWLDTNARQHDYEVISLSRRSHYAIAVFIVLSCLVGTGLWLLQMQPQKDLAESQTQTTQNTEEVKSSSRAGDVPVVLWENDGFSQLQQRIVRLHHEMQPDSLNPAVENSYDESHQATVLLKKRLLEFEETPF
jgi:eukaryotic-like serine/threonine-protein kinase